MNAGHRSKVMNSWGNGQCERCILKVQQIKNHTLYRLHLKKPFINNTDWTQGAQWANPGSYSFSLLLNIGDEIAYMKLEQNKLNMKKVTETYCMVRYAGIQQSWTGTEHLQHIKASTKFHCFPLLIFRKNNYSIRNSSWEISNNPCYIMRRGLYRTMCTKYLRHWVIWERENIFSSVQKVGRKLLQC